MKKKPEPKMVHIERDIPSIYDGKRIYCVVANSVQHPLDRVEAPFRKTFPAQKTIRRNELTRSIQQPAGRLAAQAAHVVSKVRHNILKDEVHRAARLARQRKSWDLWMMGQVIRFQPVTTIVLAARDSFELYHLKGLLDGAGIKNEYFYDENPEVYGEGKVLTAIATVPVFPDEVYGILDYLQLWKPSQVEFVAEFDASKVM